MATFDLTGEGGTVLPAHSSGFSYRLRKEVDFSVNNAGSGDIFQIFDVGPMTRVEHMSIELLTAEGGAANVGLGDGGSTSGYLAAFSIDGAIPTSDTTAGGDAFADGKLYNVADTLDMIINTAAVAVAKVAITAYCIDETRGDPAE